MMYELAQGLTGQGHQVSVITSMPKYNLIEGQCPPKKLYRRTQEDGVQVYRVRTLPLHNVSHLKRGLAQLVLPAIFSFFSSFIGKIDLSIVYSPPLPLGLAACYLRVIKGADYIFNVQDLFPQNAIDLGALKNPFLIKAFRIIEKFIYHHARYITVHSSGNKEFIAETGITSDKISVIHNWVDPAVYDEISGKSPLDDGINLRGKFVILFAGVMSYAQDMDVIMETARLLLEYKNIVFLLVGDGSQKPKIAEFKVKYGLSNIILHPFISLEEYPELVDLCDVGLVTLKRSMTTPVVPSKILGYMAAGKPVIGSLNKESEAIDIINAAGCGWAQEIKNPGDMRDAILKLYRDPKLRAKLGSNGRNYVSNHFLLEKSLAQYEKLINLL
jgi:glycosyltransferase involved in cell wall biosynthesis